MSGEQVVGLALLALAAWRWWPLWRARPAVAVGQRTSTCGITLAALCGALLVAESAGTVLATFVAGATSWLPSGLLAITPGLLTLAVAAAALEVGARGIGLAPRFACPKLAHAPLAALLPVVAVAAWPLIGPTIILRVPEAVADEAAAAALTCTPEGGFSELVGFGPEQLANAATIVAVGQEMGVPEQGLVVALATAMQESTLRNIAWGDRDSEGLFQQRPSQGWGTPVQVTDPRYASRKFYERLLAVPDWEQMPLTVAAQTVQRSAFPDAYAKWEDEAIAVLDATSGAITCTERT